MFYPRLFILPVIVMTMVHRVQAGGFDPQGAVAQFRKLAGSANINRDYVMDLLGRESVCQVNPGTHLGHASAPPILARLNKKEGPTVMILTAQHIGPDRRNAPSKTSSDPQDGELKEGGSFKDDLGAREPQLYRVKYVEFVKGKDGSTEMQLREKLVRISGKYTHEGVGDVIFKALDDEKDFRFTKATFSQDGKALGFPLRGEPQDVGQARRECQLRKLLLNAGGAKELFENNVIKGHRPTNSERGI